MRRQRRQWIARGTAVALVALSVTLASGAIDRETIEVTPEVLVKRHTGSAVDFLTFTNPTAGPLTVDAIDATCASGIQLSGFTLPFTVAANSSTMAQVTCPGTLPVGMNRCTYDVRSGAQIVDTFVVICDTQTMPTITGSPNPVTFPMTPVGQRSPSQTITLNRSGPNTTTTLHLQLSDLDGNFLVGAPCQDQLFCSPTVSLGSNGGSAQVQVLCKPTETGLLTAKLYAFTNDAFSLGQAIDLSCNGMAVGVPIYDRQPVGNPQLAARVNGQTDSVTVTVANVGSGSGFVDIDDARLVGPTSADWSIASIGGACTTASCSLGVGQSLAMTIDFDPSQIGDRSVSFTIDHDGTSDTFTLVGTGQGATADLVSPLTRTLNFGTVPIGQPRTAQIELDNQGNLPGSVTFVLTGDAQAFTVVPGVQLPTAANTRVDVICDGTDVGLAMAKLRVIPGPDVVTPAYEVDLVCDLQDTAFFANPSVIDLGEIRTGTSPAPIVVDIAGPSVRIASIELASLSPNFHVAVASPPGVTPVTFQLELTPTTDDPQIENAILVTPETSSGSVAQIAIPITGLVTTAAFSTPDAISLGTFCVKLPTMPAMVGLQSTGTATIVVDPPALAAPASPLELDATSLAMYPLTLAPLEMARIAVTPKRRDDVGEVGDTLQWSTDAGTQTTMLSATFIADGAAVSPNRLDFGQVRIHLNAQNAVEVHLQNCEEEPIALDPAIVPPPFSIDNGTPPDSLQPGETAVFAVGFHPTDRGVVERELVITSPQLPDRPLVVQLRGEGIPGPGDIDETDILEQTSFYACGCAGSRDPSGAIALALAFVAVLLPRRRRR